METLSVRDARAQLPSILKRFRAGDSMPVAFGAHGRAEAVLAPARLFHELTAMAAKDRRAAAPGDPLVEAAAVLHIERPRRWAHLSLCILDAVYSIGQRYESVLGICSRYAHEANLEQHLPAIREQDLREFRDWAVGLGVDGLADKLGSRNRTHRHPKAPYKSEAVIGYAEVLCRHGITSLRDAAALLADDRRLASVEADLRLVSGNGLDDVRLDYFWMLVGDDQRIKPDTMVRRWVRDALGLAVLPTPAEARGHVISTARKLGCTPLELDHAIWLHQRRLPRTAGAASARRSNGTPDPPGSGGDGG